MRPLLIVFFMYLCPAFLAQALPADTVANITADSLKKARELKKKTYSMPRKVTLMSAILPGLGQAYNKHYWKIPVIYAGIGGFAYMFIVNNREYNFYRKNLRAIYDEDPNTINTTGYSADNVQIQKIAFRKKRDLAMMGIGVFYLLNVIDANVSAHLKTFDISDDLSLNIGTQSLIYETHNGSLGFGTGVSLKLNFK